MKTNKTLAATPLAAALALALSVPAHAQTAVEAASSVQATELDTVEVIGKVDYRYVQKRSTSATKTDTDLNDVPQAVTVVTQDLMQDLGIQGMADAVRYVPGIGITQGEGNRDGLVFRGNSSTADLFIDGMRDDVQYYRDTYNIDRIEAFKGPNAMIFGRGSPGGLLNRVTKVADWDSGREIGVQLGSWDKKRLTADINQSVNDSAAFRVTGVYEDSEGFRDGFELKREGINPTLSLRPGENTLVTLGVEYFHDERTADRGIPSRPASQTFNGTRYPIDTDRETFFGDPDASVSDTEVNAFTALIEHDFGGVLLRNRTRYANYDKFYQNVFPGNVESAATTVSLSAYNNATERENIFNQTDLIFSATTGAVEHQFMAGVEFGRQETDNLRKTGRFAVPAQAPCLAGSNATNCVVSLANPTVSVPVTYTNSGSDANNTGVTKIAAVYLQDQIEFSPQWEAVIGVRYDRFDVEFDDLRASTPAASRNLSSSDDLFSPRVGLIYKPAENISFYTSYGITYLPRSGEQMASLTASTQSLEPEEFENYEVGAKWDISPRLGATAAVYRLNRSNVAIQDTPTQMVLLDGDAQRSEGVELSLSGELTEAWQIIASYVYQEAEITRDIRTSPAGVTPVTYSARKGAKLPQTPEQSIGVWNRYDFSPNWGVGLGAIYRDHSYAGLSNAVTLKSYTRYDGAVFYTVSDNFDLQLNVENLFGKKYFPSAHSDTNITTGAPRSYYLSARFRF